MRAVLLCAALLTLVGCGPPRVDAALEPVVLAAPDCDAGPSPVGWLVPSEAAIRGGQAEAPPPMQPADHDKRPQWLSGARGWVSLLPPAVVSEGLGVTLDGVEAPVAVEESWDPGYRPGFGEMGHPPGGSAQLWIHVDLEAWCALDRQPLEAPVWISSEAETRTLWIELE